MNSQKKKENLDLKKNEVLQAVVMGDSFDATFAPLTDDVPRCLLPLANRPILGYTLEFLKNSGVEEVFVYCASFAHKVKQYLEEAQWTHAKASMNVVVITNEECRSFGDAMRDLDGKGLLRHDFILLHGDTVSNVDLRPILEEHKQRAQKDKTSSMTLVYKKAAPGHPCRTAEEEVVLATNAKDGKILHHQRATASKLNFPLTIFEEADVELRFDLLDPCISICSHAIPPLFADNFDLQTLDDFVQGILENDLLDNTIYMATVDEAYAARISNFYSYLAVNMDVINRWLYPIVPDMNFQSRGKKQQLAYKFHRHNVYKCADARLMKDSLLEKDIILGQACTIGANSTLSSSSIGADCKVGSNVSIKNSIVFEGVEIADGCQINGSILAKGVKIGDGVVVNPKCILGQGVVVAKGVNVPGETRLVAQKASDGFSDDEGEQEDNVLPTSFGPKAFAYVAYEDSDSDSEVQGQLVRDMWGMALEDCEVESTSSEDSDIDQEDTFLHPDILLDEVAKISVFHGEIFDSLQRGARENVDAKNLVVEINSSRYAYNTTQGDVIHSVITSLLVIAAQSEEGLSGAKLFKSVQKVLTQFIPILVTYCKSLSAQTGCLYGLEEHCKGYPDFLGIAKNTIHFLYEEDVLAEDAIMQWFADEEKKFPEFGQDLREKVRPFITWLQEESEDEDSE